MIGWLLVLAVVLMAVTHLLNMAETALQRVSKRHAEALAQEGRRGGDALATILQDTAAHMSVMTFLRVLGECAVAVLLTVVVDRWVDTLWAAVLIAVAVVTVVSYVVLGVSPRTLGRQNAETIALRTAPAVARARQLLGPLSKALILIGNAVTPGKGFADGPFENEAEFRDMVDMARESAVIEADEREMIHSIFELGETTARRVMVPRTDMVVIEGHKQLRKVMSLALRSGFSRIPVVGEGGTDDILGVIHFKDVVRWVNADAGARESVTAAEVMREATFVPDSKSVDDLLREMQVSQTHLVVVIDEYGGTAGLLSIEDILEEIVGEITDEHDRESVESTRLEDGTWRVAASMDVDDLSDLFDVSFTEEVTEDVETVGGLLAKLVDRVPIVGSTGDVAGIRLTAERLSGRRHRVATVIAEWVGHERDGDEDGATGSEEQGGAHPLGDEGSYPASLVLDDEPDREPIEVEHPTGHTDEDTGSSRYVEPGEPAHRTRPVEEQR
ncbi:hemolysin family protein [Kytococcus sp. Marseille-QA3725]